MTATHRPEDHAAHCCAHDDHDHRGHDHTHAHAAGHHHHHGGDEKTLRLALLITLAFAAVEALGGWATGSLALLGDAGHMLSDSLALGIAAFAARLARRPPNATHSYGLGRVEALAALFNAALMLIIVAGISWEAIERISRPVHVTAGPAAVIAALGLILNLGVAWLLAHGSSSLNLRAALLHVLGDLLGSLAALGALLAVYFTGWMLADPLLSLLIGGLILASTVGILRETLHQLLDGVPRELSLPEIGARLAAQKGVLSVHDLHVWTIASGRIAVSAHLLLAAPEGWASVLFSAQQTLKREFNIEHTTLQPELPGEERIPLSRVTHSTTHSQTGAPQKCTSPRNS
ncbi:cation diffusion facilitator family transporter [Niveibacterium terrae]|uniref:cation diffusion facilitator family transporter n=1 Tax=Niveibacterium terrae TaxID=3373598 RepID=UPI003A9430B1